MQSFMLSSKSAQFLQYMDLRTRTNSLPSHLKDTELSYNEFQRHFCLDSGGTAQCELRRLEIFVLTYLH